MNGIFFDLRTLRAVDLGAIFGKIIGDGKVRGCTLSYSGANLTIAKGHMVAKGRLIAFIAAIRRGGKPYMQAWTEMVVNRPVRSRRGVMRFVRDNDIEVIRGVPAKPTHNALYGCTHHLCAVRRTACGHLHACHAVEILQWLPDKFLAV